ncbi:MAG: DUF1631 domain-containing protein, partial [Pseudomonadota bacterium]|nr:DUF1631 domain-containing protein [Pseudomonadota bacterium]
MLEEIKRLAVEQLGALPGLVYSGVEYALENAAHAETIRPGHFEDVSTLRMLRQQSASLMMRYRQQVAQGFDDFRGLRVRNRGDLPLGLIEHDHLEFHLAGQRVAEVLAQRHIKVLEVMHQRLHWMTTALGMSLTANPIGPERLTSAFVETFHESETTATVRDLLFREYEKELDRVLDRLYRRVNQLLADAGYDLGTAGAQAGSPHGGGFAHDNGNSVAYRDAVPQGAAGGAGGYGASYGAGQIPGHARQGGTGPAAGVFGYGGQGGVPQPGQAGHPGQQGQQSHYPAAGGAQSNGDGAP